MHFKNREEAGRALAEALAPYRGRKAVVFALPRGGVVVGHEVAQALDAPLDIVVTRKVGHPDNPEYAICAVDEKGSLIGDETEARFVDQAWLKDEIERQKQEAARRIKIYRGERKPALIVGKTAIIVDDGIATGLTMRLAVRAVKAQKPEELIVAVPVAPQDVRRGLADEGADDVLVVLPLEEFSGAVGAHDEEFGQGEDAEVIRILRGAGPAEPLTTS